MKANKYVLSDDHYIGYTTNTNKPFYFDIGDFDLVSKYIWHEDKTADGYSSIRTTINGVHYRLHTLLGYRYCDHIDRDTSNNRRSNLRESNKATNAMNHSIHKTSSSGICGVSFNKQLNKWDAYFWIANKKHRIGSFQEKNDAIRARLIKEKEHYGDFAPQRDLFSQYGV